MKRMPSRDLNGHCDEGECRDTVSEGNEKRQKEIKNVQYSGGSSPSMRSASSRNEAPGFLGGHV